MRPLKPLLLTIALAAAWFCAASNTFAQQTPGTWYLSLDTGLALQADITDKDTPGNRLSFDPGFRLDLSGGVHLTKSWSAEIEVGFLYNSVSSIDGAPAGSDAPDYFQVPIMANVLYSLPLHGPLNVYVGAGAGGVSTLLWTGLWGSDEGFTFGYQGILGAKYALSDNLDLGLSYKLLGTLEHELGSATVDGTLSHSILAAITFKF